MIRNKQLTAENEKTRDASSRCRDRELLSPTIKFVSIAVLRTLHFAACVGWSGPFRSFLIEQRGTDNGFCFRHGK